MENSRDKVNLAWRW